MAMTNEEIDAEIARLTKLKEQNNQAQAAESTKPATGIYNPADYVGQIANNMNKSHYGSGDEFSNSLNVAKGAGKRNSKTEDMFGNPLPGTAYEYITQMLNSERAKGPVNKHTLRMIENAAKLYYNMPSKFDISGKGWFSNTDSKMAKAMNSMAYSGKQQTPVQNVQPQQPSQSPQAPAQQATKATSKPQGNQVSNTNKGVAGANVGDHIIRSDGSVHVLTKGDIDWAKKRVSRQTQQVDKNTVRGTAEQMKADIENGNIRPTYNEDSIAGATQEELDIMKSKGLSDDLYNKGVQAIKNGNGLTDDDMAFMNKYKQYTQQLSGLQPRNAADLKAMQESEAHKFITDKANVERYRKLYQRKKSTKK